MIGARLDIQDATVRYGDVTAVSNLTVSAPAGAVTAVLGANGSGKSSLARAAAGLVPILTGRLLLDGTNITGWPAHRIRQAGMAYLPEGRGVFAGLSVVENLRMAARLSKKRSDRQDAIDRAYELFPVLYARRGIRAGQLSGGEQQMLALARALAIRPRLVIADELSLGLAPRIVEQVYEAVDTIRRDQITIIIIEQFVKRALALADHCILMAQGRAAWEGPPTDAAEHLLEQYLGVAPPK
jgi:branched-chain amino acid transport system ATP-binding protein